MGGGGWVWGGWGGGGGWGVADGPPPADPGATPARSRRAPDRIPMRSLRRGLQHVKRALRIALQAIQRLERAPLPWSRRAEQAAGADPVLAVKYQIVIMLIVIIVWIFRINSIIAPFQGDQMRGELGTPPRIGFKRFII